MAASFLQQLRHTADGVHAIPGHGDDDGHLQDKLEKVGPQHAPQSAEGDVNSGERHQEEDANGERFGVADAHRRADDVDHGLGDPTQNQAIHQQAQIHRAESSQERRRLAGITKLSELHVGDQAGAPPEPREQEHGHHSRRQEAPPKPVARDSLGVNQSGYRERRVRGKRRSYHRRTRQPPTDFAARNEIIFRALSGFPAEIEPQNQRDDQIRCDRCPIECCEVQVFAFLGSKDAKPVQFLLYCPAAGHCW